MPTVSIDTVEQTTAWFANLEDESAIAGLIDQIAEGQPFLFAYLMAMGEGDFNEDEREVMLFLGLTVYQMALRETGDMAQVTEEHLDRLEQSNMQMLEQLSGETEAESIQVLTTQFSDYPQPHLLEYVVETVFEEETDIIRPNNRGVLVLFLKIVIDCLNEVMEKRS